MSSGVPPPLRRAPTTTSVDHRARHSALRIRNGRQMPPVSALEALHGCPDGAQDAVDAAAQEQKSAHGNDCDQGQDQGVFRQSLTIT